MSMIIETKLADGTIVTSLGTLEWNLRESTIVIPSHFADMRPTTEEDLQGEKIDSRWSNNYSFIKGGGEEVYKKQFVQELIYVTVLLLHELERHNITEKVLFCYAHKILRWDQQIQCNVYKSKEISNNVKDN